MVEFWSHIFVLQIFTWIYFCGIYRVSLEFLGILQDTFQTIKFLIWATGGRPTGQPNQGSVDRLVDRHARIRAHNPYLWAGWPCGRPTGTTQLSGRPDQPGNRPTRQFALGPVDQAVDRQYQTVKFLTVGQSTGRSTDSPFWANFDPNSHILLSPI